MHWTRVSLFCLGAALLASSQPALAQVVSEQTGVVQLDDYSGSMALSNDGGSWMQVDRMSGDGVGFQSGYTRVGVRNKWLDFGESHLFTEINGTINDQSRLGTNLNLGWRTMYDGGVFGVFGAYDNYESNYGKNYQQGVVGAEYLHEWLDLRANGYVPFGDRDNFIGVVDPGTELTFFGHDFGTIGKAQIERSLAGFDLEGGVPLPVATFLRIYGGTYFLTANDNDTWGVRSRIEARVGEGSAVNFMVSDDERFGTNLNLNATVWYGGGPTSPFKFRRDRSGYSRRYDPIRRAQTVQLAQDRESVNVPLTNAETGERFNITWVDNTAAGGGDGTVENPFNSLPDSAPGSDHVLVKRGVGNTIGNIVLEDNQHLWGEGRVYQLSTIERGIVTIPDAFFDQTGTRPTLAPRPGDENIPIVTLANNNEVINFFMTGGTAPAVEALNPITNFRLEHLDITSAVGINLVDAGGVGILNDIQVRNVAANQTGIFVRNSGGDVLNLDADNLSSVGGDTGLQIIADQATVTADINGLMTDRTAATAIILGQFNGELNVTMQDVEVRNTGNNTLHGILVDSILGSTDVAMDDVQVRGVGDLLFVRGLSTDVEVTATNSDFSNSLAGTGITIDVDDTTGVFGFENIIASNNSDDGFRLNATNGSTVNAAILDSDVSFNGDNNFDVTLSGGSVVNFFVDPTTATDSGNEAFSFVAFDANTVLNATFEDVDLARAGGSAISGAVDDGAEVNLFLTNVQASDSGLHGLNVSVTDSSDFFAQIENSTFTRSGLGNNGRGVNLIVANNSIAEIHMDSTPANNNGAEGLHYEVLTGVDGASTLIGTVTNGNFSDNSIRNVFGLVDGAGSTANWTFTNVTADLLLTGGAGAVELASLNGGQQQVVWSGLTSSISQSATDGVNLTADGANSILNFIFSDGQISQNGGQGIDAQASNGAQILVDLENVQASFNTNENILANALTGGQVVVNALNSDLSNGGLGTNRDNVLLSATGAGSLVGGVFDGVNVDNSGLNGLHADINAGGSLDMQFLSSNPLAPSSASNNLSGSGIRIEATNADSINVVSSGNSIISDNNNDNVEVDVAGANFAFVQIAGLMDRSVTGDGINIDFDSVLSGGISVGPGSASDNADDGVDIRVTGATTVLDQGISISNVTATGNGDEPIVVVTSGATITGGSIDNNTTDGGNNGISWSTDSGTVDVNITNNTVTNATDNGILVTLNGTAIGNEVHIDFNPSITGNGVAPLNGIQLRVADNAQVNNGSISGNGVSLAANYGILVNVTDNGLVDTFTADGNTISSNGIDGFLYTSSGNTTLNNLVISDNASSQNVGAGISVLLDSVAGNGNVEFRGNLATTNGTDGIVMTGINTSLTNLDFLGNEGSSNGGNGIRVNMTSGGVETLGSVFGQGNIALGNAANGIHVTIDGFDPTTPTSVFWDSTTASNNTGGRGLFLELQNHDFSDVVVIGSSFSSNGTDGVGIQLTNANADNVVLDSSTSELNTGAGAVIATTGSTIGLVQVSNNNAGFGSGLSNNGASGLQLDFDSSVINSFIVDSNVMDANGLHGVEMNVTNNSTLPLFGSSIVSGNTITGHGAGDGFHLVNPDTNGTDFGIHFDGNTITGNTGGSGVNLTLNGDSGIVTTAFTNNTLSDNGNSGLLANLIETANLQVVEFSNNTASNNTEMGVRVLTDDASTILLDGSVGGNVLDGNSNAGLGVVLAGTSTADIRMSNSEITNTTAGSLLNFNGQGVRFLVTEGATLLGSSEINNNIISDNASTGVEALVIDTGIIEGMTVNGNTLDNNPITGVRFERQESGTIGSGADRVEISGNTVTGAANGVVIVASNADTTDFYELNDNTLSGLTGSGVRFEVNADADIDANMDGNIIDGNGLDGITFVQTGASGDSGSLTGIWTNNEITNNGRHGINLTGVTNGLVIGDLAAVGFPPPLVDGNLIAGNGNDGISITGAGSVSIVGNIIAENGSNGADDAAIDIDSNGSNDVTIRFNSITDNLGDGIEYEGGGAQTDNLLIERNFIAFNEGRGFDVLLHGSGALADAVINFNFNQVSNNRDEGVYVVFTSSQTQGQSGPTPPPGSLDDEVSGDNSLFARMIFNMDNNFISANGTPGPNAFSANGLVVRVGTMQTNTNPNDPGDFATDGLWTGAGDATLANFTASGVLMNVTNNVLTGNFGDDVYFESFASTQDPTVTGGTWGATADPTAITFYRADPLARLDLNFQNNSGDSQDVTNVGAFYDLGEGTFKSRTNNANAPFQGPFSSATRRRNAQRLADRTGLPPAGGNFVYSGMGGSTFRVRDAGNVFTTTISGFGDIIFRAGPDEVGYGWDAF